VRLSTDLGGVRGAVFDPAALRQILHNLVRNAVEAMESGGAIRVRTRVERGKAVLEVSDEGTGIRPEDLDRVFEFGFTTKAQGNGLGLPIVHRLASEMGGSVAIDSEPVRGTTVSIRLPLATGPSRIGGGSDAS